MGCYVIVQARMGSTRLPGKVMMDLCGYPLIWHVVERLRQTTSVDKVIVATSKAKEDDPLYEYLQAEKIPCCRGDESDVLGRYYDAYKLFPASTIVRATGDNPLIDPKVLEEQICLFYSSKSRYVSAKNFPLGLCGEVFESALLEEAFHNATEQYEHEHVTPYMYLRQDKCIQYYSPKDLSNLRFTVDTSADFEFISEIYKHFFNGQHNFFLNEILDFLSKHSELLSINRDVQQKTLME